MIDSIRQVQKKYCSRAMTVAIFAGFACILAGQIPVGKGLVLGAIFSVINFVLMGESLPARIGKGRYRTFFHSLGSIGLRYTLMAVPLVVAVKYEEFNLIAVVAGLFLVQVLMLFDHLRIALLSSRKKQQV